jgi:hypothetical protein
VRIKSSKAVIFLCGLLTASACGADLPENLAQKAHIGSWFLNSHYMAKFVADGYVPEEGSRNDQGYAWAADGNKNRHRAQIQFVWAEPVTIGEIIYYGRTAWYPSECFKDYHVLLDDIADPVTSGQLKAIHGPQRIKLPTRQVQKLTLRFTSSYGGPNPGASEIQIFSLSPTDDQLKLLVANAPDPYFSVDRKFEKDSASIQLKKDWLSDKLGFKELVVIQRQELNPTHVYTYHYEGFRAGGGLYILKPNAAGSGLRQLVDSSEGQILDCDLSYNAQKILFSWRKSAGDTYHLYTINVDGTDLQQLTDGDGYDFNACWLPDGDIVFLSTRKPAFAYCWTSPVGTLYRMSPDGENIKRISANYLNDFTPSVLNNGKIIYGRWEYVDRPAIPIQSLWTLNPDGTNLAVYYGNRVLSPATFIEPQAIPESTNVLCTLTAHNGPCRGAIGIIDPSHGVNAQESIRNLTPEISIGRVDQGNGNQVHGPYESPYPVNDNLFLCSRRGTILLRDYDGTKQTVLIRPKDNMSFYNPRPLRKRNKPAAIPSALPRDADNWATVYLQNVYNGLEPYVKRGQIKQICVVQEIEKPKATEVKYRAFGFQFPVVSCGATYSPKKVWGYAEVADDGSAHFKVPAGVPIYFMALDQQGRALQRMRSFTHLMPGEVQGCIGCHEPRNQTSRNRVRPAAMKSPVQELKPPEWGVRGFSYSRIVQPALDQHCVQCHNTLEAPQGIDLSGDETDFFNVSYETLARRGKPGQNPFTKWIPTYNGQEANILAIEPKTWGSPASKLAEVVLSGHPDERGKPRFEMDEAQRRRILAWIDLNVPYYGTSASNYYRRIGCRQMIPDDFERVFNRVTQNKCGTCHTNQAGKLLIPRKQWLRITNPQLNNFLLAPLAKSEGGTEACGKAVFKSKDDLDYQAILKTFEPLHQMLKQKPRMDMKGTTQVQQVCDHDYRFNY